MNPKPYRLGLRQGSVDETRARILAGARRQLRSREAVAGFSVDAVARLSGVTRATVYHHFKSRAGLLESLYDSLASRAGLRALLVKAFRESTQHAAVRRLVIAYSRLWATERAVIRRLHALSDVAVGFPKSDRDEWRRNVIRELLRKSADSRGRKVRLSRDVVDAIHMLTSFETYDGLARGSRVEARVVRLVSALAVTVVGGRRQK
jgi:AcrR family transcriptional regulator